MKNCPVIRYFIIDRDKFYHSGNFINHIGYRKSSIDLLHDVSVKRVLINNINKIIERNINE